MSFIFVTYYCVDNEKRNLIGKYLFWIDCVLLFNFQICKTICFLYKILSTFLCMLNINNIYSDMTFFSFFECSSIHHVLCFKCKTISLTEYYYWKKFEFIHLQHKCLKLYCFLYILLMAKLFNNWQFCCIV